MINLNCAAKLGLLSVVALGAASCQGIETKKQSELSSLSSDLRANHCEVFIDKVMMTERWDDSGSRYQSLQILVRVLPERVDGPVRKVVFHREKRSVHSYGATNYGWDSVELSRFGDSSDYFDTSMLLVNWNERSFKGENFIFEGALYVETERGTRYWANAGNAQGFRSTAGNWTFSMDNLKGGALSELPILNNPPSIESLAKTSQLGILGSYLNPQKCE